MMSEIIAAGQINPIFQLFRKHLVLQMLQRKFRSYFIKRPRQNVTLYPSFVRKTAMALSLSGRPFYVLTAVL